MIQLSLINDIITKKRVYYFNINTFTLTFAHYYHLNIKNYEL